MYIDIIQNENVSDVQNIYLTKQDIYNLINEINIHGEHMYKLYKEKLGSEFDKESDNNIKYLIRDHDSNKILENEYIMGKYIGNVGLLEKIKSKLTKQLENTLSPILLNSNGEFSIKTSNGIKGHFFIETKEGLKYDFPEIKETLLKYSGLKLNKEEDLNTFIHYIESHFGFSISKTALLNTLKEKGFLEDQVIEKISPFIIKKQNIKRKVYYKTNRGEYDPNIRVNFIFNDFFTNNDSIDIKGIIDILNDIEKMIKDNLSFAKKIESYIATDFFQGKYIFTNQEEKINFSFNGMFRDANNDIVDIVDEIANEFHLDNDDINTFVNTRKRTLIDFNVGPYNQVPHYYVNGTKFGYELM